MCMMEKDSDKLQTTEEKLDALLLHVKNLDRRDRMRTIWGTMRSIIGLLPLLLLLGSLWYVYHNSDRMLRDILTQTMQQVSSGDLQRLLQKYMQP